MDSLYFEHRVAPLEIVEDSAQVIECFRNPTVAWMNWGHHNVNRRNTFQMKWTEPFGFRRIEIQDYTFIVGSLDYGKVCTVEGTCRVPPEFGGKIGFKEHMSNSERFVAIGKSPSERTFTMKFKGGHSSRMRRMQPCEVVFMLSSPQWV